MLKTEHTKQERLAAYFGNTFSSYSSLACFTFNLHLGLNVK